MHHPTNVEEQIIRKEKNDDDRNIAKLRHSTSLIRKLFLTYGNDIPEQPRQKIEYFLKLIESKYLCTSDFSRQFQGNHLDKIMRMLNKLKEKFKFLLDDEVIVIDDTSDPTDLQSTIKGEHRFNPSPPQFPKATTVTTNPLTAESAVIAKKDHTELPSPSDRNAEHLPDGQKFKAAAEKKTLSTVDDNARISVRNIVHGKRSRRLTNLSLNEDKLACKVLKLARLEEAPATAATVNKLLVQQKQQKQKQQLNVDSNAVVAPNDDSSYNSSKCSNHPSKSIESSSQTATSGQIPSPDDKFTNYESGLDLEIVAGFSLFMP